MLAAIALACVVAAAPHTWARAASGNIVESFNGKALNRAVWALQGSGMGPVLQLTGGHLELSLAAASHAAPQHTDFFVGIQSQCSFTGDIDVRVTFTLLDWPVYNGARAGLILNPVIYSPKGGVHVERASWSARDSAPAGKLNEVYASNFYDGVSYATTADTTGRLRLVRRGNRVTSYLYQSGRWVPLHVGRGPKGTMRVALRVWGHDPSFEHHNIRVAFDNLRITKGHPTCARSALPG